MDRLISILTTKSEITVKFIAINCLVIDNCREFQSYRFSKSMNDNSNKAGNSRLWWNLLGNNGDILKQMYRAVGQWCSIQRPIGNLPGTRYGGFSSKKAIFVYFHIFQPYIKSPAGLRLLHHWRTSRYVFFLFAFGVFLSSQALNCSEDVSWI